MLTHRTSNHDRDPRRDLPHALHVVKVIVLIPIFGEQYSSLFSQSDLQSSTKELEEKLEAKVIHKNWELPEKIQLTKEIT